MATWKLRHEGSPQHIEGLTLPQVVEGLRDGLWEPTDEVMGPDDRQWAKMEAHPQLAEIVGDIEPPPPKVHEDETRLDMNPLIDVALVLLIFFILTTTYETIRKVLDMPGTTQQDVKGPIAITKEQVEKLMVMLEVRQDKDRVMLKVEGKPVAEKDLEETLRGYVRGSKRTELLIDSAPAVEWGTLVAIQDAAKGAGMQKAYYLKQAEKK